MKQLTADIRLNNNLSYRISSSNNFILKRGSSKAAGGTKLTLEPADAEELLKALTSYVNKVQYFQ